MDAPILISLHWDIEFHVHTNASNLAVWGYVSVKPYQKMQPTNYLCIAVAQTMMNKIIPQLERRFS
jgi:hypothetical protein